MAVPPFPVEQLYCTHIEGRELATYVHWLAITYAITLTATPVVVIPCGRDPTGTPFGLQVVTRRRSDRFGLGVAAALERAFAADPELTRPLPDLAALRS